LSIIKRNYISAIEFSKVALKLAEEIGAREQKISALRAMGKALASSKQKEKLEDAVFYLEKTISISRKEEMKFELAKSLYELAKVYLFYRGTENGERETVEKILRYLKEAEKIFQKIGAGLWLKKTQDLMWKLSNS